MSTEPCGAMNRDGSRCQEPPAPESRFCKYHGRNGGPSPLWIWRAPRSETTGAAPPEASGPPTVPPALAASASAALTIADIALDDIVTDVETQRPPDWVLMGSMER